MTKDPDSIRDEIMSEENLLSSALLLMMMDQPDESEDELNAG